MSDGGTREKAEGLLDKVAGRAKEFIGNVSGNKKTEAEGLVQQGEGEIKEKVGEAKDVIDKNKSNIPTSSNSE